MTCLQSDEGFLSLGYYSNNWFDSTFYKETLGQHDSRFLCLKWLEEGICLDAVPKDSCSYAYMLFYIFSQRLQFMDDTLTTCGDVHDLKSISDLEGYMSEIAMDYCMMCLSFEVKNVFPIHSQVFNLWNVSLCYNTMKRNLGYTSKYTDCNLIEDQANNRSFMFIIPYFEGCHYSIIVRRWIGCQIYFLYNDSSYKTEVKVYPRSTTFIPYEVFGFLMNSPLWPQGTTVRWVRIPSKQQEEDECGFRSLLHAYILVKTLDPLRSLLALNFFGSSKSSPSHPLHNYKEAQLPQLCRGWVKDIMLSKRFKSAEWIQDVLNYRNDRVTTPTFKDDQCLNFTCTLESDMEVKEIIRQERKREKEKAEEERTKQRNLLSEKSRILECHERRREVNSDDVNQMENSIMGLLELQQPEIIGPNTTLSEFTSDIESTNNLQHEILKSPDPIFTSVQATDQNTSLDLNSPMDNHKLLCSSIKASIEGSSIASEETISLSSSQAEDSNSQTSGGRNNACMSLHRISICFDDVVLTRNFDMTDESQPSINDRVQCKVAREQPPDESQPSINDAVQCKVACEQPPDESQPSINDTVQFTVAREQPPDESQPSINDTVQFTVAREQPPQQQTLRRNKKARNNVFKTVEYIDCICKICNRPVGKQLACDLCSTYIHEICGFMIGCGKYACIGCYNTSNTTRRRVSKVTGRDSELSELWSSTNKQSQQQTTHHCHPNGPQACTSIRGQEAENTNSFNFTDLTLTRHERTVLFNQWLCQITCMMCKRDSKGHFRYFGCHEGFCHIREMYSKFVQETLFENEMDLLGQLQSSDMIEKWCTLPPVIKTLIQTRGDTFSNHDKFLRFDQLEQQEWSFLRCSTFDERQMSSSSYHLVDSPADITCNSFYISVTDVHRRCFVDYVPKYYIYRWHRFCDLYKGKSPINEFTNLLNKAKAKSNRWVRIDAGRLQNPNKTNISRKIENVNLPTLYKVQGFGENTCVFASIISTLHYMNDYEARDLLETHVDSSADFLKMVTHQSVNREGFAVKLLRDAKYHVRIINDFDVLCDRSIWPTLCILKGSNNCITHAVTVVQNYIFDSSVGRALTLTRKNLNWCCGSDYQNVQFDSVHLAYRFQKLNAPWKILIRNKKEVSKAIEAFIRLFTHLRQPKIAEELGMYLLSFDVGEDFMNTILGLLFRRPHNYMCQKIKERKLGCLLSANYGEPMVLLLSNRNIDVRLITLYEDKFFDGSRNPAFSVNQTTLMRILKWETISWDDISIERGYKFLRPNEKVCNTSKCC